MSHKRETVRRDVRDRLLWAVAKPSMAVHAAKTFRNWPSVDARIVLDWLGYHSGTFVVKTRSGLTLTSPPNASARGPLLEVLSEDAYRLHAVDWDDSQYPFVVLDIGAHVGSFTCALAQYLPSAIFNCVEPSEDTTRWLNENLRMNGLSQRATVVRAAIASQDGEGLLWETGTCSCVSSTVPRQDVTPVQVHTTTLESLTRQIGNPPHIVKIDCEGAEYEAILGSPAWCWQSACHVFLEHHPVAGYHFSQLQERFEQFSLALVWHRQRNDAELGTAYFVRTGG